MGKTKREEWDSHKIAKAKAAYRKGASWQQCAEIIGSKLGEHQFRERARKLGMSWSMFGSTHAGTSKVLTAKYL